MPCSKTLFATFLNLSQLKSGQQATPSIALQQRQNSRWWRITFRLRHRRFQHSSMMLWQTHSWNSWSSLTLSPMMRIIMPSWVTIFCSCWDFTSVVTGVRGGTSSEGTSFSSSSMTLQGSRKSKQDLSTYKLAMIFIRAKQGLTIIQRNRNLVKQMPN